MKKISLIIICFIAILQIQAQPTLLRETHGLRAGDIHINRIVNFPDKGKAGKDVIWDFSELKEEGTKISYIKEAEDGEGADNYPTANITIDDGKNNFFYDVSDKYLKYVGLYTGKSIIYFNEPIIRMQYPFSFGQSISNEFRGEGMYGIQGLSNISGEISVNADAYGTLILPNGIIKNALRVKTQSRILEVVFCGYTETITTKYLWYIQNERYPVFALLETESRSSNSEPQISKKAYYSEKVLASRNKSTTAVEEYLDENHAYQVYPNPTNDKVTININMAKKENISASLYDMNGRKLKSVINNQKANKGSHTFNFSMRSANIPDGIYFIKINMGNKKAVKRIILARASR